MQDWISKDKDFIWHPYTSLEDTNESIFVESAKGAYLYTSDGKEILDAVSSWWVNIHGHSNEYIAKAIATQAATLEHVIFAGFTHGPAITLAERLLKILPGEMKKFFYSDNGSTAVEVGIKMAVQYWFNKGEERNKLIAIEGAYHGDTFGAMSVADRGPFSRPFHSMLFDVEFIKFPYPDQEEKVVEQFRNYVANGNIAAFIYEPLVQGAGGMRIYSSEVLDELLKIAKEHKVLCIADEVMTGFGRTGKKFASEYMEEKPDIVCLSKGITGGVMALGATAANAKIVEAFKTHEKLKTFFHGHSFTANPMACAASNASLDILLSEDCQKRIESIMHSHLEFAEKIKTIKSVKEVKCLGTILSIEISHEEKTDYFNNLRDFLYHNFLSQNILLRPLGNIIYIMPPYVIEMQDLERVYDSIKNTLLKLS